MEQRSEVIRLHHQLQTIKKRLHEHDYDMAIKAGESLRDTMIQYTDTWRTLHEQDSWFVTDIICWTHDYVENKDKDDLKAIYDTIKTVRKIINRELLKTKPQ